MFCPRCGSTQDEDLKFCKSCGANLYAVRRVVDSKETDGKVDRNAPWFAAMALSDAESRRREEELYQRKGIAPEIQRYNEIKAGVITGSVGIGIAALTYTLMQGIILSGNVSVETAQILSRLWVAGLLPLLVGLALIINGMFVSKKLAQVVKRATEPETDSLGKGTDPLELRSADTTEFAPSSFSVTEGTTKHLESHRS
ncbi:MAG TPA: zinc ribbon domain-containing protein [Pyrinomonadaceae bacterium]|nr:zinc ribbon domain-containing protein [Pyrinomonadaceae bacterium]